VPWAQVIGEKTAGAANPGRPYPVNDVFEVTVPNGQIRSAIEHSNWEGDGVTPDVSVPAINALDIALDRAREDLRKREDLFYVAAFIELR
jgi:C-terminal processing protease CtpA/Prc